MATKIRLMRMGATKRPFYRLVVVDSRNRRDGRYIENLGTYNPIPKVAEVKLKDERILYWLSEGVQLSGTAENLIRREGIIEKHRLLQEGMPAEEIEAKLAERRAKQPQASSEKLSRAEKRAKKKTDARTATEAAAKEAAEAKDAAEKAPVETDSVGEKSAADESAEA